MSSIRKRKADAILHKDQKLPSKRVKHTTSTQPSEQSPPARSATEVDIEANDHGSKSFQDLGIIQSLCDACTALGYKVHMSL